MNVAASIVFVAGIWSRAAPPLVDLEPPRGNPDGVARLVISTNPARSAEEQLALAGVKANKPKHVLKTRSGRVIAWYFEKTVPVSTGQLSILHIGKRKLLVPLEPKSAVMVRFDDCAMFALEGDRLASYGDYCERDARDCMPGYTESTESVALGDGLCAEMRPKPTADERLKYCVRDGEFRIRATPGTSFEIVREGERAPKTVVPASGVTQFYWGVYQRCWRTTIITSSDEAIVVVGSAQRLTVDIAPGGRIVGGVVEDLKRP